MPNDWPFFSCFGWNYLPKIIHLWRANVNDRQQCSVTVFDSINSFQMSSVYSGMRRATLITLDYISRNMYTVRDLLCFWSWDFNHILQGCFTGTGAILWLPRCQWSNPDGYGQTDRMKSIRTYAINHTKHSRTVCIFHDTYCMNSPCIAFRNLTGAHNHAQTGLCWIFTGLKSILGRL